MKNLTIEELEKFCKYVDRLVVKDEEKAKIIGKAFDLQRGGK